LRGNYVVVFYFNFTEIPTNFLSFQRTGRAENRATKKPLLKRLEAKQKPSNFSAASFKNGFCSVHNSRLILLKSGLVVKGHFCYKGSSVAGVGEEPENSPGRAENKGGKMDFETVRGRFLGAAVLAALTEVVLVFVALAPTLKDHQSVIFTSFWPGLVYGGVMVLITAVSSAAGYFMLRARERDLYFEFECRLEAQRKWLFGHAMALLKAVPWQYYLKMAAKDPGSCFNQQNLLEQIRLLIAIRSQLCLLGDQGSARLIVTLIKQDLVCVALGIHDLAKWAELVEAIYTALDAQ
jgi:hypothetical protein